MKKELIITIIIVALVIGGVYVFVNKDKYFGAPKVTGNVVSGPQTYNIEISNMAFSPAELNIKAGDSVIWTNKDNVKHIIISSRAGEMLSKTLANGDNYTHMFNKTGEFNYTCAIYYNKLKGQIIVS